MAFVHVSQPWWSLSSPVSRYAVPTSTRPKVYASSKLNLPQTCSYIQNIDNNNNADNRQGQSAHSLDNLLQKLKSDQNLNQFSSDPSTSAGQVGTVYLVGTGPGDPGLLTLRALHLMSRADVVLYDRLVSNSVLSFVNPSAVMVYVGKEAGFHTRSQNDIHLLLSFFAQSHSLVVRLKGGDPFVFGRGGEETEFLESAGVRVAAVPGITAASGIAANLGIPLTMRGYATSVRYLTGHITTGVNLEYGSIDDETTYVIYMGLAQLESISNQLIVQGLHRNTPSVAIQRGTTAEQRVLSASLHQLHSLVQDADFKSPTLIIVGKVVSLASCWERRGQVLEGCNQVNEHCFENIEDPTLQKILKSMDESSQIKQK